MNESNINLSERLGVWESISDYPSEIRSLSHGPSGEAIRRRIQSLQPAGKIVADLGCGPGYFLSEFNEAETVYAVDWSENMMAQAKSHAPEQTSFIQSDMRELELPQKAEIVTCFNALFPENHADASTLLMQVLGCIKPSGKLFLILPSFESILYNATMRVHAVTDPIEQESTIRSLVDDFVAAFNNPLGYVHHGNGLVNKHWLAEEMENLTQTLGIELKIEERFKVSIPWTAYGDAADWHHEMEPPWFWGWLIEVK